MTDVPMLIGIYGSSGFGSEVYPLVSEQYEDAEIVFIDDSYSSEAFLGVDVLNFKEFIAVNNVRKFVVIAIADSKIRQSVYLKCEQAGIQQLSVKASNAVEMMNIKKGEGCILSPFTTVTSNVKIGKCFHANIYSYIAHDCTIGDFVTFAPSVKCNGNVIVEDYAYIGTGAIIKQGTAIRPIVIGEGAVVGMGAVVTKSVPAGQVVIGNPAKPLNKESLRGK